MTWSQNYNSAAKRGCVEPQQVGVPSRSNNIYNLDSPYCCGIWCSEHKAALQSTP